MQLSVIMLVVDGGEPTARAIASLRCTTTCDHELVIVDNGSRNPATRDFLAREATVLLRNETNIGVPRGWNQALRVARGDHCAIANDDILFVEHWYERLSEWLADPGVGLVAPASLGGADIQRPQATPVRLEPFGPTPHGLLMLLRTTDLRRLGGFCEAYGLASNEDKDLCFTLWEDGLDIVIDHRVVIPHEGGSTWRRVLGEDEARRLWKANRELFKKRWRHRV